MLNKLIAGLSLFCLMACSTNGQNFPGIPDSTDSAFRIQSENTASSAFHFDESLASSPVTQEPIPGTYKITATVTLR